MKSIRSETKPVNWKSGSLAMKLVSLDIRLVSSETKSVSLVSLGKK